MKLLATLLAFTVSLRASLVDKINQERQSRGVAPVTNSPLLSDFLENFFNAQKAIPEKFNRLATLPSILGPNACRAFPKSPGCFERPVPDFFFESKTTILYVPYSSNESDEIQTIRNKEEQYYARGEDAFDPIYISAGEFVKDDEHYVILSPFN
ncbi:hypothetical protein DSO57_1014008 [Entomophthora muscae]|uniref:Uncharacterized protein n=1 Tax=Entomophthora muscae TaxID=34485 RepID=A0ACC2SIB6_9FUNG|nr:hypothetical protein DSO57_1014008 [Entomophthora muscae]